MKDIFIKWFMAVNTFVLRISRGRIGSKLGKQRVLVLHTTGRKSGLDRAVPIAYFEIDDRFLIVASNWGKDTQANWYHNLKHDPHASLEVKGETIAVLAHEAQGEEYERLWAYATGRHAQYLEYQQMTDRRIPIMVFERG